jgi:hypothetical protein
MISSETVKVFIGKKRGDLNKINSDEFSGNVFPIAVEDKVVTTKLHYSPKLRAP